MTVDLIRINSEFEQYSKGFPPENLLEFREWVDAQIAHIPKDYRSEAQIDIGSTMSGDCSYSKIEISYCRPMTAEEISANEARAKASIAAQIADAERRLEILKKKSAAT